jgi:hypothetical protein
MREPPKFYLSLTIVDGQSGYFRPLLDLTLLIASYFIVKSLAHGVKYWLSDTIRTRLNRVRRGLKDGLAVALGLHKIQFVAAMG